MKYDNMTAEEICREVENSDNDLAKALLEHYDDLKCSDNDNDPEEEHDRGFSKGFEDAREEAIRLIEMM